MTPRKAEGVFTFQHTGANKALELVARVQGHLAPVQTQEVPLRGLAQLAEP